MPLLIIDHIPQTLYDLTRRIDQTQFINEGKCNWATFQRKGLVLKEAAVYSFTILQPVF